MPRVTYANVTATLALFIALGGTSYAVTKLPANSVGPSQLRKDAVSGVKIQDGTVDLADLTAAAKGARGPRGAAGPAGPAGPSGTSQVIVRRRVNPALLGFEANASIVVATMQVPAGTWFVQAVTNAISTRERTYFRGTLAVDGKPQPGQHAVGVGGDGGGAIGAVLAPSLVLTGSSPQAVTLTCSHDATLTISSDQPRCERTTLTATKVDSLDIADVTG